MKRLLAVILVFIILLSALVPVLANPVYDEVGNVLKDIGVLQGDTDTGDLMLDKNLLRQDMVVMISRLYKDEKTAENYKDGKNVFKDLGVDQRFYIPYITWAKDQGLVEGMEKDKFGFNGYVTVQQFQTILLRSLKYGEEAKDWKSVPEVAKSLGIMKDLDLNPSSNLSRGEMAYMVLNALNETQKGSFLTLADELNLDVPEIFRVTAEIDINKNSVNLKGSVQGVNSLQLNVRPTSSNIKSGSKLIKLDLDSKGNFSHTLKNLETGSYEYRFESGSKNTQFKSFKIDEVAFDFIEAKADNLKEIHLLFTQSVDTNSASFPSNYQSSAGGIKDISFRDDNRTVVLALNGTMTQQKEYKLSAFRIKSKDGQDVEIKDVEFNAFDNKSPKILETTQIGNKGIKLEFSEPIRLATAINFKINGEPFNGDVILENNIITLIYPKYVYNLNEGTHTINISGIEDYAGYKIKDIDEDFQVIKDEQPPIIIDASASLETAIIEFDKDIDPVSENKNNFYWKSGNMKRYPDKVTFSNNKAYLEFKNNKLQYNENMIYVENVMDYSDNKMKLSQIGVTPIIDKTNPELISYKVAEDGKSIDIYYSKDVQGKTRSNYSIKDMNDKTVYIRDIQGSGREFTILLSSPLPVGRNTLNISGVEDTTSFKNILIEFETVIDMDDVEKPKMVSHAGYGNYIMVEFSKEMDLETISNTKNYYINFDGKIEHLPSSSLVTLSNDGKSFTILLPDEITSKKVFVGQNLTSIEAHGLKDTTGNYIDGLKLKLEFDKNSSGKAKAIDYYKDKAGKQGVLIDENTMKIKFNIPIVQASEDDFLIVGRKIEGIDVNESQEIILYLDYKDRTSIKDGDLYIKSNNKMKTYIDTDVEGGTVNLVDEVAPRVISNLTTLYTSIRSIELPFTEELESEGAGLYRRDLEVIREEDGYVLSESEYSTSLKSNDKSIIQIYINSNINNKVSSRYSVSLKGQNSTNKEPNYIRDTAGNLASSSGSYYISDTIAK